MTERKPEGGERKTRRIYTPRPVVFQNYRVKFNWLDHGGIMRTMSAVALANNLQRARDVVRANFPDAVILDTKRYR